MSANAILSLLKNHESALVRVATDLRDQALERVKVLSTRADGFQARRVELDAEVSILKARLADPDESADPGALNRELTTKEGEIGGLEERLESLSQGGDAYLAAKRELDKTKESLHQALHLAICAARVEVERHLNTILEQATTLVRAWNAGINDFFQEKEISQKGQTYGLQADRNKSDFNFRGSFY